MRQPKTALFARVLILLSHIAASAICTSGSSRKLAISGTGHHLRHSYRGSDVAASLDRAQPQADVATTRTSVSQSTRPESKTGARFVAGVESSDGAREIYVGQRSLGLTTQYKFSGYFLHGCTIAQRSNSSGRSARRPESKSLSGRLRLR